MGLVDEWNESRRTREPMQHGERQASIENEIGGSMKPDDSHRWTFVDLLFGANQREPQGELEKAKPELEAARHAVDDEELDDEERG